MSGTMTVTRNEDSTIISIRGRFNYEMHSRFHAAYCVTDGQVKKGHKFIIDLAGTDYLDSSALGMLLLLREETRGTEAKIEIINAHPEIRRILETANFQKLFKII